MGYTPLTVRNTAVNGWVVDAVDHNDIPAYNLSERHAKELAKQINELLMMSESELCTPKCQRCGISGRERQLAEFGLQSVVLMGTAHYAFRALLCGKCLECIQTEVSGLAIG